MPDGSPGAYDEYPFASTIQGGANASVRTIRFDENSAAGNDLNLFYQGKPGGLIYDPWAPGVPDGGAFWVKVLPLVFNPYYEWPGPDQP